MKEAMRMDEILFWNEANDDDSFSIKNDYDFNKQ